MNWFDVGTHNPKIKKRDKEFFGYKKYVKPKITDIIAREKKKFFKKFHSSIDVDPLEI